MTTFFDVVTVTCFVALVIAFFQFTNRETKTLLHFVVSGLFLPSPTRSAMQAEPCLRWF